MANEIPSEAITAPDLERNDRGRFLVNYTVRDFSWNGLTATVKDRQTKTARDLINGISGHVQRGMFPIFYDIFRL